MKESGGREASSLIEVISDMSKIKGFLKEGKVKGEFGSGCLTTISTISFLKAELLSKNSNIGNWNIYCGEKLIEKKVRILEKG